jgi:predicted acetyltransferase
MPFEFRYLGVLTDGVVDLSVEDEQPEDPARGYVPCYHFRIARHGSEAKIGEIRLRVGSVVANPSLITSGHVGYSVEEPHRGHGIAARACALLKPVALAHGMRRVVITCDPTNVASRRTCERLGAVLVGVFDVPRDHEMYAKGRRKVCRYLWILAAGDRSKTGPS